MVRKPPLRTLSTPGAEQALQKLASAFRTWLRANVQNKKPDQLKAAAGALRAALRAFFTTYGGK